MYPPPFCQNSSARTHNIWGRPNKSRGGVQKSIFLQKKWIFRWSVTEIHQHGPTTFGVGRKKVAKSIFLQKNQNLRYFLQKFISTDPQHLGSDEKNSQKSIFLQKNQNLRYFLQKFIRREKRPKKGNCYHYTYKGCYLFIFTK